MTDIKAIAEEVLAEFATGQPMKFGKIGGDARAMARHILTEKEAAPDKPAQPAAGVDYLKILEAECWDLRCVSESSVGDDADVLWEVIGHWMAKPQDRIIGRGCSPVEAIKDAIRPRDYDGNLKDGESRKAGWVDEYEAVRQVRQPPTAGKGADGLVAAVAAVAAIRPDADAPESSERAYRQACNDCIGIIRAHTAARQEKLKEVREALETLARLGNGDKFGNSIGNFIAQKALATLDAIIGQEGRHHAQND